MRGGGKRNMKIRDRRDGQHEVKEKKGGKDRGISGREKRNEERERAREGMGRKKMVG